MEFGSFGFNHICPSRACASKDCYLGYCSKDAPGVVGASAWNMCVVSTEFTSWAELVERVSTLAWHRAPSKQDKGLDEEEAAAAAAIAISTDRTDGSTLSISPQTAGQPGSEWPDCYLGSSYLTQAPNAITGRNSSI